MKRSLLLILLLGITFSLCNYQAKAQDFCSVMEQIRQAMTGDFSTIKGTQYWDEKNSMNYWSSTVTFPGSTYSDIEGESSTLQSSAYYRFAKAGSFEEAKPVYDQLKSQMQSCKPSGWYDDDDDDFSNDYIEYIYMDPDYYNFDPGKYISLSLSKDKTDGYYYVEIIFATSK